MPENNNKGKNNSGPNRKTHVVVANVPNGQARGRRDRVTVPQCNSCNRAHPNIDILEGESGGSYYDCPQTGDVVFVRIR